jgi:predicted flap endonuclease-1-like 5' DNA nuclease
MPEITLLYLAIIAVVLFLGGAVGWLLRSNRNRREKFAISAGWQAQIDSQQSENDRLAEQNKSLMQQVSQYQASNKDSQLRAKELSDSLKEAFQRRDELQRQLKDIRGNLEVAIAQRDKLRDDVNSTTARGEANANALRVKDERISRLKKELENWQARVPPLVERYRQRDLEAQQLEIELQKAGERIVQLESRLGGDETRIEPIDSGSLPDGLDASNEPHGDTTMQALQALEDQIDCASEAAAGGDAMSDASDNDEHGDEAEADSPAFAGIGIGSDYDSSPSMTGQPMTNDASTHSSWDETDDAADDFEAAGDQDYSGPGHAESSDNIASAGNGIGDAGSFHDLPGNDFLARMYAHDDLKQIKGVGPAIEKLLNDLGIFRYVQIAEMTEYDIDRVAQQLKGFRSRIYREDWIGQTRTLELDKHSH